MKKTWQWIIQYQREIDSEYHREMVNELLKWREATPYTEPPPHLLGYEAYFMWIPFTERMFQSVELQRTSSTSSEAMKPRHLNVCLKVLASILNAEKPIGCIQTWHQQQVYEMKRMLNKAHLRIYNVKTKEVIPAELMIGA